MKHEATLAAFTCDAVQNTGMLSADRKKNLQCFFRSALAYDPSERELSFEALTSLLGQPW